MTRFPLLKSRLIFAWLGSMTLLTGCITVSPEEQLSTAQTEVASLTQTPLTLVRSDSVREARKALASELLGKTLDIADAVALGLTNSPDFQVLLARHWAEANDAASSARLPNPLFGFERLRVGDELEITRTLSFGLMDLLLLPQRYNSASRRIASGQLKLAGDVVDHIASVRIAWVKAVASKQRLVYAEQVMQSAELSAELARRMQAAGNFNRLDRLRQQAFYADATTQLAIAQQVASAEQEALVRLLGLNQDQLTQLRLPDRLPDLPESPVSGQDIASKAMVERLDIRLAKADLASIEAFGNFTYLTTFTDIELGLKSSNVIDKADGEGKSGKGFEAEIRLPLFDWGDTRRDKLSAEALAAMNQYESVVISAASGLRENYVAYRTAFDIARHYRDEVIPLRKAIAEENVLRYNGMLIGVFELLADNRNQIDAVIAAISYQEQFWLADGALQTAMLGRPTSSGPLSAVTTSGGGNEAAH